MEADRKIIIAVDFGTTYSGLAWAQTRKPELQSVIIRWPDAISSGLEGATSDKVPTEIQYLGQDFLWGFQIPEFSQRQQWFKLELDPSHSSGGASSLAIDFPDMNAAPPQYDHSPEKMVEDYLTSLRKHAENFLKHQLPESALATIPIEYVLTVPAVWSDMAQEKTRACAQRAGMGEGNSLHMISEPEAAAIYALDAMDPHPIKIGDTFIVCDAGGGTVDLISYKVTSLKPKLQISEAAPGSGSSCGSTFLNRIFEKFLKNKLGNLSNWDDDVLEEAMQSFEFRVKRGFSGDDHVGYPIPVPGMRDNARRGIRRGKFRVTGADVRKVFEPVVKEVITLIEGQIKATQANVKAVLLVGGLGQNSYLRERIRKAINIEVMQPPNGWTAIVRGALMKGLASTNTEYSAVRVKTRSARKHYGLRVNVKFNAAIHKFSKRCFEDFYGEYRSHVMDWIIKKGELLEENKPKRLGYNHHVRVSDSLPCIATKISMCSDTDNLGAPLYSNVRVQHLVTLTADLSGLPYHEIPVIRGKDGHHYFHIEYQIEVTHYSAYTQYELIYNDKNYGPVKAEYV